MSDGSTIEWLAWPGYRPASWNPAKGCTRVSEGCRNCYAEIMAARFSKPGQWGHGLAEMRGGDHRWTGRVELDEAKLLLPLRWVTPRCVFVNSTSDLFHERLPDEAIDRVFAVMALCPQHRFIILTKRAERMRAFVSDPNRIVRAWSRCAEVYVPGWPLPNVILGVSVEDQATADERIPHLLATQAACRMVSAEPLLGAVDFTAIKAPPDPHAPDEDWVFDALATGDIYYQRYINPDYRTSFDSGDGPYRDTKIEWVVSGGESGHGARPMHPDWARSIRDQCRDAGVAYFHKQNGAFIHSSEVGPWTRCRKEEFFSGREPYVVDGAGGNWWKVGKHRAGRLLDGRTHDEVPEVGEMPPFCWR